MIMSSEERRVANMDVKDISICIIPDSVDMEEADEYEECMEDQEPQEDMWFCPHCSDSPCEFLQFQEEIEGVVNVMDPALSNKSKRYKVYRHMSRRRFGTLGKGNHRPLPSCFEQGIRDLYPSENYTGYKTGDDSV